MLLSMLIHLQVWKTSPHKMLYLGLGMRVTSMDEPGIRLNDESDAAQDEWKVMKRRCVE